MKTISVFISFALSHFHFMQAQTHRIILPPIADTYLDEANPASNIGLHRSLFVGPQASAGFDKDLVALVKFNVARGNIPGVPYRSTITAAFLNLYLIAERGALPTASRATSPDFSLATENAVTWNNGWDGNLSVPGSHFDGSPNGYRFDVLPIVQSWYTGRTNYNNGFLIAAPQNQGNANTYQTFYSRRSSNPPELVIIYDPPLPLWKPFESSTMAVQAATGFSDAAISLILLQAATRSGSKWGGAALLGMVSILFAVQLPLAIHYAGEEMGGDGSLFWTFAGCIAGGSTAILPAMELWPDNPKPVAILAAIFAVAGGIFGYHYFASPVYESDPGESLNVNQVQHSITHKLQIPSFDNVRATLISINF